MKKRFALILAVTMLSGCAQPATPADSASEQQASVGVTGSVNPDSTSSEKGKKSEEHKRQDSNFVMGKVKEISGSTITLLTMSGGPRGIDRPRGDGQKGEPPSKPENDSSGSTASDESSSQSATPPDQGQPPENAKMTQEEKSITVPDDCKILVEKDGSSTVGSLSDITADTFIRITYAEDGATVSEITVGTPNNGHGKRGGRPGPKQDNDASFSASA